MEESCGERSLLINDKANKAGVPTQQYGAEPAESSFESVNEEDADVPGAPIDDRLEYV